MSFHESSKPLHIIPKVENEVWDVMHGTEKVGQIVRVCSYDSPIRLR